MAECPECKQNPSVDGKVFMRTEMGEYICDKCGHRERANGGTIDSGSSASKSSDDSDWSSSHNTGF